MKITRSLVALVVVMILVLLILIGRFWPIVR